MKEIGIVMLCSKHTESKNEKYDGLCFKSAFNYFHVKYALGKEKNNSIE